MRRNTDHAADLPDALFRRTGGFNRRRFEDLVRYIAWICEDPRSLGTDRLNLVLWHVDRGLYLSRAVAATGACYLRHRRGPVARPLQPTVIRKFYAAFRKSNPRGLPIDALVKVIRGTATATASPSRRRRSER